MRSVSDLAQELLDLKKEYARAIIVVYFDRDELFCCNFVRPDDGFDAVVDELTKGIQDGGQPMGLILATGVTDDLVGLDYRVYPEHGHQAAWADEVMRLCVSAVAEDQPRVMMRWKHEGLP